MSTTETPPPPPPTGGTGGGSDDGQDGGHDRAHDGGPRIDGDAARDLSRLRRTTKQSREGRYLGGVAGGIARHLDVDPLVVRVALVVLVFFGGAGLVLYAGGWLLIPEDGGAPAPIKVDPRSRAVLLWVVVGLAVLAIIGDSIGTVHVPWPLIVIGAIVLWLVTRKNISQTWAAATGAPTTDAPLPGGEDSAVTGDATAYTRPVRQPDPRRTGPRLFWFTLALIALAAGILGTIDVAGAHVAAPAYPALALGIIGIMLVVGAFYGRAGGLILIGLIAALALALATAGDKIGPRHDVNETPLTSAAVAPAYSMGTGRLSLDLTRVADPSGLEGRTISLSGRAGRIEVTVPPGTGVDLRAHVHGPGVVRSFGDAHGGIGVTYDHVYAADPGQPTLIIVADLKVGAIEVDEP